MIDRTLLSRLPTPTLIKLASLSPTEAVDHLRHAARLCLDGARTLAFQDDQQQKLADKLIKDAIALYDMAILRQRYPPLPLQPTPSASTPAPTPPRKAPPLGTSNSPRKSPVADAAPGSGWTDALPSRCGGN